MTDGFIPGDNYSAAKHTGNPRYWHRFSNLKGFSVPLILFMIVAYFVFLLILQIFVGPLSLLLALVCTILTGRKMASTDTQFKTLPRYFYDRYYRGPRNRNRRHVLNGRRRAAPRARRETLQCCLRVQDEESNV